MVLRGELYSSQRQLLAINSILKKTLKKNALLDFSKDPETKNEKSMDAFKQTEDDKRMENEKFQATMASMTKINPDGDAATQADKRFDKMVNNNPHEVEPVKQAA